MELIYVCYHYVSILAIYLSFRDTKFTHELNRVPANQNITRDTTANSYITCESSPSNIILLKWSQMQMQLAMIAADGDWTECSGVDTLCKRWVDSRCSYSQCQVNNGTKGSERIASSSIASSELSVHSTTPERVL